MEKGKIFDFHRDIESPVLIKISEIFDAINKNSRACFKSFNDNDSKCLMYLEDLVCKIETIQNNIQNNMKVLEMLEKKIKIIEKCSTNMKCQEFAEIKDIRLSIEDVRNKQNYLGELEKCRKMTEIYEKCLGISIKIQKNIISISFSHMGDGSLICCLSLIKYGNFFKLNQCTPFVPRMSSIIERLNIFRDFCDFLKEARKAFSKHLVKL